MRSHKKTKAAGFTLIELLVVVAIIAVLIAILLPSLNAARRIAKTVKCSAQIKAINLAMAMYGSEYNQAILGNAHTTGAFLLTPSNPSYSESYCPTISQTWDWTAPVAKYMNIPFDEGGSTGSRQARFRTLNNTPALVCPENDILAPSYSGAAFQVPTTLMVSYNTASVFQYVYNGSGGVESTINFPDVIFPGYRPKISLVGNPSSKVFIADGGRWTQGGTPDVNLGYLGSGSSPGGHYADYGPWSGFSRAYLKPDGPTYSMRHGAKRTTAASLTTFQFNLGFFDGHVETMSGLEGANPALWTPKGSTVTSSAGSPPEVITKYFSGGAVQVP